jgi:hypothetical protein
MITLLVLPLLLLLLLLPILLIHILEQWYFMIQDHDMNSKW